MATACEPVPAPQPLPRCRRAAGEGAGARGPQAPLPLLGLGSTHSAIYVSSSVRQLVQPTNRRMRLERRDDRLATCTVTRRNPEQSPMQGTPLAPALFPLEANAASASEGAPRTSGASPADAIKNGIVCDGWSTSNRRMERPSLSPGTRHTWGKRSRGYATQVTPEMGHKL